LWGYFDAPIRFGLVAEWDNLPRWKKIVLMAKARAEDTMAAWESYQALPKDQQ
jgi:hypothetical protein